MNLASLLLIYNNAIILRLTDKEKIMNQEWLYTKIFPCIFLCGVLTTKAIAASSSGVINPLSQQSKLSDSSLLSPASTSDVFSELFRARFSVMNSDFYNVSPFGNYYSAIETPSIESTLVSLQGNEEVDGEEIAAYIRDNYGFHPIEYKKRLWKNFMLMNEAENFLRKKTLSEAKTDEEILMVAQEWGNVIRKGLEFEIAIAKGEKLDETMNAMTEYYEGIFRSD